MNDKSFLKNEMVMHVKNLAVNLKHIDINRQIVCIVWKWLMSWSQ